MEETELELVKKQLEREREESKMWREKYFAVRKELDERIATEQQSVSSLQEMKKGFLQKMFA